MPRRGRAQVGGWGNPPPLTYFQLQRPANRLVPLVMVQEWPDQSSLVHLWEEGES